LRALCADAEPRIRREALTALAKLGGRAALEDAKRLLSDPDETVALAAGEAYRQLKGSAKAAPVRKRSR
jgi:HEAT repeat protein